MSRPDTQIESWERLQPDLGDKQAEVLRAIEYLEAATLFEICAHLHWPINSVSGRVTELFKNKRIRDCGQRKLNPITGRSAIVWVPIRWDGDQSVLA